MLDVGIAITVSIATLNCNAKDVVGCFANAEHVAAVVCRNSMNAQDVKSSFDTETHSDKHPFVRGDAEVNLLRITRSTSRLQSGKNAGVYV